MSRDTPHRYRDPLDLVWLRAAREVGLELAFSDDVFASYDGAGTLTLCNARHYDPDDSLAQLILHELCHALVAGDGAMTLRDWGLANTDERDLVQEHACHRLQAALADRHGLRELLAVTTDHRPYWDALPMDPLGIGSDLAIPIARQAFRRATEGPWAPPIARALEATRAIAELVRDAAPAGSLWAKTRALHASGLPMPESPHGRCGDCAWSYDTKHALRCRQTKRRGRAGHEVGAAMAACERFEQALDADACGRCGACCREAFHVVELRRKERFVRRHPTLVHGEGDALHLPRPGGRCLALDGDGADAAYRCRHYADRPRSCRDFAPGGDACLEARRRLGLSA